MTVKDIAAHAAKNTAIKLIFDGLVYPFDTGADYPRKIYEGLQVAEIYANNNELQLVIAVTPKF